MIIESKARIKILDSFRFIAILLVVFFHYFSRFSSTNGLYPYGKSFSNLVVTEYGYLGVHFFFIISGFVIFMTLERCISFWDFIVKRIIRLFPAMLFCSILTFLSIAALDSDNEFPIFHKSLLGFLPSLTFTDEILWRKLLGSEIGFIDGAYWSLAVEVKFYIISGIVYFYNRRNFFRNWIAFTVVIFVVYYGIELYQILLNNNLNSYVLLFKNFLFLIFFKQYIVYFTLGILFYMLFLSKKFNPILYIPIIIFVFVELFEGSRIENIFIVGFIFLFLVFIYRSSWLHFLTNPFIATIGLISYPLYLIHQYLGLLLIHKISIFFNDGLQFLSAFIVMLAVVFAAYLIHNYIEYPFQRILKFYFLKKSAHNQEK